MFIYMISSHPILLLEWHLNYSIEITILPRCLSFIVRQELCLICPLVSSSTCSSFLFLRSRKERTWMNGLVFIMSLWFFFSTKQRYSLTWPHLQHYLYKLFYNCTLCWVSANWLSHSYIFANNLIIWHHFKTLVKELFRETVTKLL